jgi:dihydroorotase
MNPSHLVGVFTKGEVSSKYDIPGIDHLSEAAHVERGCRFAGETGCHFHVLHISTAESIMHVREAKKKGWPVSAEVSPHHLLLCDTDIPEREPGKLNPNWKMNPPLRSAVDREMCVEALVDGTIDMIATDHAPHSEDEKARDITEAPFGIVGLETSFPLIYTSFVKNGVISLEKAVDMMTTAPAKLFDLPYGTLNEGAVADVVLINLDKEITINPHEFLLQRSQHSICGLESQWCARTDGLSGEYRLSGLEFSTFFSVRNCNVLRHHFSYLKNSYNFNFHILKLSLYIIDDSYRE